jgi:hypothetical protein
LHALIPRYDADGNLVRYDPAVTNAPLAVHEEFRLDRKEHTVTTARGPVQARAYFAPHGQSLIVDQRCASKYDLERSERFLEDSGQKLVIEIRILSCAPDVQADRDAPASLGVSTKFASPAAKPATAAGMAVKELLFIRRVFNRIIDANPARAAAAETTAATSSSTRVNEGGAEHEHASNPTAAVDSALQRASLQAAEKNPNLRASLTPAALAALPIDLPQVSLAGRNADASASSSFSLSSLLYPRSFLLRRYQLTDMLPERSGASTTPTAANAAAITREQAAFAGARAKMMLVDFLLLLLLAVLLLHQFGLLSGVAEQVHTHVHVPEVPKVDTAAVSQRVHSLLHIDAADSLLHRGIDWMREQLFPTQGASATAVIPAPSIAVALPAATP